MQKKLNELIKALEKSLKILSNAYTRYYMYSIYEDLLLLTSTLDEAKKEQLYLHINKCIIKLFGSNSKLFIEEKEEYSDNDYHQILLNVERVIKKVF